ncbi:hypothetical protein [Candidatus Poriferisodalis sp.]|uniref:hypothetical protein n=1 Tax=Candidatus Poriferisodalis sp. TaxID=3101277 RepID=UPI003B522C77
MSSACFEGGEVGSECAVDLSWLFAEPEISGDGDHAVHGAHDYACQRDEGADQPAELTRGLGPVGFALSGVLGGQCCQCGPVVFALRGLFGLVGFALCGNFGPVGLALCGNFGPVGLALRGNFGPVGRAVRAAASAANAPVVFELCGPVVFELCGNFGPVGLALCGNFGSVGFSLCGVFGSVGFSLCGLFGPVCLSLCGDRQRELRELGRQHCFEVQLGDQVCHRCGRQARHHVLRDLLVGVLTQPSVEARAVVL